MLRLLTLLLFLLSMAVPAYAVEEYAALDEAKYIDASDESEGLSYLAKGCSSKFIFLDRLEHNFSAPHSSSKDTWVGYLKCSYALALRMHSAAKQYLSLFGATPNGLKSKDIIFPFQYFW